MELTRGELKHCTESNHRADLRLGMFFPSHISDSIATAAYALDNEGWRSFYEVCTRVELKWFELLRCKT